MSKVAFLTDSSSDIPAELAEKYGIEIACFPVNLDGREYIERKDMTNDEFYEMMRQAAGCPTTAAITSIQWLEFYSRFADEGYTDVVHVPASTRAGSSTYANAVDRRQDAGRGAARLPDEDPPGGQPHLLDGVRLVLCASAPARCATAPAVADAVLEMEEKFATGGGLPGRVTA